MEYLGDYKGTEVTASALKNHMGRRIVYLTERDIDKSGRGYFFPRTGKVEGTYHNNVIVDGVYIPAKTFREIKLL